MSSKRDAGNAANETPMSAEAVDDRHLPHPHRVPASSGAEPRGETASDADASESQGGTGFAVFEQGEASDPLESASSESEGFGFVVPEGDDVEAGTPRQDAPYDSAGFGSVIPEDAGGSGSVAQDRIESQGGYGLAFFGEDAASDAAEEPAGDPKGYGFVFAEDDGAGAVV